MWGAAERAKASACAGEGGAESGPGRTRRPALARGPRVPMLLPRPRSTTAMVTRGSVAAAVAE